MYNSPLLQTPLPQPTRPLPDIYIVNNGPSDGMYIGMRGHGTVPVPEMVLNALAELSERYWLVNEAEKQRMAAGWPQMVLLLCCRYEERGYVEYERVPSSATPSQSAASGIA